MLWVTDSYFVAEVKICGMAGARRFASHALLPWSKTFALTAAKKGCGCDTAERGRLQVAGIGLYFLASPGWSQASTYCEIHGEMSCYS